MIDFAEHVCTALSCACVHVRSPPGRPCRTAFDVVCGSWLQHEPSTFLMLCRGLEIATTSSCRARQLVVGGQSSRRSGCCGICGMPLLSAQSRVCTRPTAHHQARSMLLGLSEEHLIGWSLRRMYVFSAKRIKSSLRETSGNFLAVSFVLETKRVATTSALSAAWMRTLRCGTA